MLNRKIVKCCAVISLLTASTGLWAQNSPSQTQNNNSANTNDVNPYQNGDPSLGSGADSSGKTFQNIKITNQPEQDGEVKRLGVNQPTQQQQLQSQQQRTQQTFPPLRDNDFQKFVRESTGKKLAIFGADFFTNIPSTFAPLQSTPVPSDYTLSAGDEIVIRGWGNAEINFRAVIDRNGLISIPTIGTIPLAGVKSGEAEQAVRAAVGKIYKDVNVSVTFGQLRAITVYVVGQARKPGSYTVSGFSTLVTALFASGGANANGSLRHVQVKRNGKLVRELDLYSFIAKGDKSADIRLQDGDTIYIPAASGYVALVGNVNTPAVYELHSDSDTVESILEVAGGLPVVADPRRATVERIDATKSQPRSVEEFVLDKSGVKKTLKNGDLVTISSITPEFANAVTLRGNVDHPVRSEFKNGMRVSDLIPNREFLVTRIALRQQNDSVKSQEVLQRERRDELNSRYETGSQQYGIQNPQEDMQNQQYGMQNQQYGMQSQQYAQGLGAIQNLRCNVDDQQCNEQNKKDRFNSTNLAEHIVGSEDEVNWDYAVIERLDRQLLTTKLIPFNLGKVMEDPTSAENVLLQPGDTITIFSQNDIRVPIAKRKVFVRVEGEVNTPGVYQMSAGDSLKDLLAKAGGTTSNAYVFGTEFYREEVRKDQELNLQKAIQRLETQSAMIQSKNLSNITASGIDGQIALAKKEAEQTAAAQAIARLKTLKPNGRIAFALDAKASSENSLPQIKLQNGDRLVIPNRPDFVSVYGSVNQESSMIWYPGMTLGKYLDLAGPNTEADLGAVFVIRADGTILSSISNSWFSGVNNVEIMPGDSIVVPEKQDKETSYTKFVTGLKDWSQILSGFGLTAAAIKSLSN